MSWQEDAPDRAECEAEAMAEQLREACLEDEDFVALERIEEFLAENRPKDLVDLQRMIDEQKREIEAAIMDAESERRDPMNHYGLNEKDFR